MKDETKGMSLMLAVAGIMVLIAVAVSFHVFQDVPGVDAMTHL